jgi:hypothetical protein
VDAFSGPQFKLGRMLAREKTCDFFPSTRLEAGAQPIPQVFGTDPRTGQIQNSNTAFREFQRRMNEIADL